MPFQYAQAIAVQKIPTAPSADTSVPTFAGIASLVANANGSLTASWAAATGTKPNFRYRVYISTSNVPATLFAGTNIPYVSRNSATSIDIWEDGNGAVLQQGVTYYVGIRAIDAQSFADSNTVMLSAISQGVPATSTNNLLNQLISTIGSPAAASVSADIASVKSDTSTLTGRLTSVRAGLLDNLDVAISTRAAQTDMNTLLTRLSSSRANNLDNLDATISSRASQSSIANIQNNTNFSGIVPTTLLLPTSGSKTYKFYARLFNEIGQPVDADSQTITATVRDTSGTVVSGPTTMTRDALGQYSMNYAVNSSDTERSLYVFFAYAVNGISFSQVRSTEVQEFESKLDTLLARLTVTRAGLIDNLDVPVSSRLDSTDSRLNRIDVPISSRSTDTDMQTVLARLTATRAAKLDNLDVLLSSRADQATILTSSQTAAAVWNALMANYLLPNTTGLQLYNAGASLSAPFIADAVWNADRGTHAVSGSFGQALDVQVSSRATDAAATSILNRVNLIPTNPLLTNDARLGNLDATISSRVTQLSFNDILGTGFDSAQDSLHQIRSQISGIAGSAGDATEASVQEVLSLVNTRASSTSLSAARSEIAAIPTNPLLDDDARLNNLDAPISSRATNSDMQLIKGAGFVTANHSLVEIRQAIAAANLDISPVMSELQVIKGTSFVPGVDALKPLNDIAKVERAQIKADTDAFLGTGEGF